jgi:uroporphyrinogen decarboxylase
MYSKQERMTGQERLDALFNNRKPDRVPIGSQWMSIGFNTVNVGGTITEAYDDPEKSFNAFLKTTEQYGWDHIFQCFRHTVSGAQDFGGEVRLPKGEYEGALIVVSHPVTTEKDIENLQLPDPKTAGGIPKAMEFAELQKDHGLPVSFCSRSPFTLAANICGLELFLKWLIKKPQLCEYLIQIALDHIINVLSNWAERFGPDRLFVWMSSPSESNQVISPKHFEKYVLLYHVAYHERLKSLAIWPMLLRGLIPVCSVLVMKSILMRPLSIFNEISSLGISTLRFYNMVRLNKFMNLVGLPSQRGREHREGSY